MRYEPFPEDVRSNCKKMRLKKDLIGGRIKAGTIIFTYHKFRIYVPKPGSGDPPKEAARFEFGTEMYDSYFEPADPVEVPAAKPAAK